jgi:hypothetical protein
MVSDDLDPQHAPIMRAVRQAGEQWADAMRSHKLAPPDPGFASRVRALGDAAAREQVAWEHAHTAGLMWRPVPGAEQAQPPYELRPGTGRRGPADLWARFDRAVASLNTAITGSSAAAVADAFGELSEAAAVLAEAIAREDRAAPREDRAVAREDRAASPEDRAPAREDRTPAPEDPAPERDQQARSRGIA